MSIALRRTLILFEVNINSRVNIDGAEAEVSPTLLMIGIAVLFFQSRLIC